MSSEQLADGVNPLDAELAATWDVLKGYSGRDTDLGIARRFGGATAAYSLRDIGAINGRVVRVRRDSDDTEEDFSANQIASGALETFVQDGADYDILSGNFTVDSAGSGTDASISNESKTGFTATVVDKAGFFGADLNEAVPNGSNLYISFIANLSPSGGTAATPNFSLADSSDKTGNSTGSPLDTAVVEGFNSITVAGTANTCDRIRFTEGNDNVSFIISDLKVSRTARNGFVETWYDQSANQRDAIQGTATNQPSIVQNGGIVRVNSKLAITFDGNDNFLEVDGTGSSEAYSFSPSGDFGMFIVSKQLVGNVVDSRDAGGDGIFLQQSSSNTTRFRYNASANNIDVTATRDAQHYNTMTLDGTTLSASVDGGTAVTKTVTAGVSTTKNLVLGKAFSGNNSNFLDGEIQEAIFYENNKTTDKANIEADIDNFYSIT